jgi:hypothetical protein
MMMREREENVAVKDIESNGAQIAAIPVVAVCCRSWCSKVVTISWCSKVVDHLMLQQGC